MAGKRAVQYLFERNGRYWCRVVVPADVRGAFKANELRAPLGGDLAKAKQTCGMHAAGFLRQIAEARACKGVPVQTSAVLVAHRHYAELLSIDDRMRVVPRYGGTGIDDIRVAELRDVIAGRLDDEAMAAVVGPMVDTYRKHGVTADPGTPAWRELARTVAGVELEALRRVAERDDGDFTGEAGLPILKEKPPEVKQAVAITGLFDAYLDERQSLGKGAVARKRWAPVVKQLVAFLGHNDAERLTPEKAEEWITSSLARKAAKTVRDTDLGSMRAVFKWALRRKRVSANPFADITLDAPKKVRTREKGHTDDEALAVLKAARAYQPNASEKGRVREYPETTAAKRWIPILCAYTGARVAELAQLRREDVRCAGDIHYVRITPEAGSVKTGAYRDVLLHAHVIELGFLVFAENAGAGPLFYRDGRRKPGAAHPSKTVSGRLSEWIGDLGVLGKVAPNHGWRHRLRLRTHNQ